MSRRSTNQLREAKPFIRPINQPREAKPFTRLFKKLATLRWRGATPAFAAWAERMKAPRLLERCEKAAGF